MKKIAVVTGASSGIGREFAIQISRKYRSIEEIWIIARRMDRLNEVKHAIKGVKVRTICLDLTKESDITRYKVLLEKNRPSIRLLVNAAGYGVYGHFDTASYEDNLGMIELNCKALTAMTYLSLPYMSVPSNIINIASSAAFLPQPSFSVYAATKSMVLSFSRALNKELSDRNITVTAVCPGPVKTEFFDIAEKNINTKAYKYLLRVNPKNVVKKALCDVFHEKAVSVYSIPIHLFRLLAKCLPHGLLIHFIK